MRAAERTTTARERRSLRVALTTSASLCPVLLDHRTPNTTSRRRSPGWRSIACADAADGPARTLTTHRRRRGRRRKRRRRSDAERVRPGGRTLLLLSRNANTHHPSTRERPAEAAAASAPPHMERCAATDVSWNAPGRASGTRQSSGLFFSSSAEKRFSLSISPRDELNFLAATTRSHT